PGADRPLTVRGSTNGGEGWLADLRLAADMDRTEGGRREIRSLPHSCPSACLPQAPRVSSTGMSHPGTRYSSSQMDGSRSASANHSVTEGRQRRAFIHRSTFGHFEA